MTTKGHQLSCSLCALASLISVGTFFSFLNSNVFWYRRFRRFSLLAIPSFISYSSSALVVVSIQYSVSTSDPFNDRLPTLQCTLIHFSRHLMLVEYCGLQFVQTGWGSQCWSPYQTASGTRNWVRCAHVFATSAFMLNAGFFYEYSSVEMIPPMDVLAGKFVMITPNLLWALATFFNFVITYSFFLQIY